MKRIFTILLLLSGLNLFGQTMATPFEKSDGKSTGTYQEVIKYYESIASQSDYVSMEKVGMTDSGFPLHLVLFDADQEFEVSKARERGKIVLLINNGIHPGEPDGIEASMMFLRDIVFDRSKTSQYSDMLIGFIPIYNIGGALNRNSHTRANQNGPDAYGFRGNAQNRDLNRDFIKMDTRNAMAFAKIFHMLDPDVFIDTHVSNGADYQYTITHLATQPDKLGGDLGTYMQNTMIPSLEDNMRALKSEIIPYVNSFGTTPDKGYGIFMDAPRYSTGYTTLFNTLGFMIETHMLKPFDQRVQSTYHFFEVMGKIILRDKENILNMRSEAAGKIAKQEDYTITWRRNRTDSREITFKGYEPTYVESPFGGQRLLYDRSKPFEKLIPYYDRFDPGIKVKIPEAYIIPQGWHEVIDRLKLNNIKMESLENDTTIMVESYTIGEVQYSRQPYEGHFLHRNVIVSSQMKQINFRKGDLIIPTTQTGIRYIIETLEPEAGDSFFKWNFFDSILQQKEYFSSYVFEDVAKELIANDADLKKRLESRKAEDDAFANNRRAQLDFIYRNSQYYEPAHLAYPVYRVLKK